MAEKRILTKEEIRKKEDGIMINMFFYLILPFVFAVPVMLILYKVYYYIQSTLLSDKNSLLLFIHDEKSQVVIVAVPIILALLFIVKFRNKKRFSTEKQSFYSKLILIISSVSVLFFAIDFFHYSSISTDGIKVREGITKQVKVYAWDDVEDVEVQYDYGYKNNIEIEYYVNFRDGNKINAYNSNHFFDDIKKVDDYILDKNIPILRDTIKNEDMIKFKSQFEGKGRTTVDRLNVLIELFQKQE